MQDNQPEYMKLEQLADLLQLPAQTIRRYCAQRRIDQRAGFKVGHQWRFRRSAIEKGIFLKGQ